MSQATRAARLAAIAFLSALAIPGVAAAAKPTVRTLAASVVTTTGAQMNGTVNPNGAETFYYFQVGLTTFYGSDSAKRSAGKGNTAVRVSAPVAGLAPNTRYHYRLIASNRDGRVNGPDQTFRTAPVPLSLSFAASPNPVRLGAATVLSGQLAGTNNGGRQVQLQANPWPFTQGFAALGNALVTDASGNFAFPILTVPVNTQYRVLLPARPQVVSPVVTVGVQVRLSTHARPRRIASGARVRFSGSISPAKDGQPVTIQKRVRGVWTTVAQTVARHRSASRSTYRRRVAIRRSGVFRVMATVTDGAQISTAGRPVRIRVR